MSARRVEERRPVGDAFRDDPVAGFAQHHVGGRHEIRIRQGRGQIASRRRRQHRQMLARGDLPVRQVEIRGAERSQHERPIAGDAEPLTDLRHVARRATPDERDVRRDGRHRLEPPVQRQPQRAGGRRVGVTDDAEGSRGAAGGELVVAAIDPVPGEVAEGDRRHARPRRRGKRERWDVTEHHRRAFGGQEGGLHVHAPIEALIE